MPIKKSELVKPIPDAQAKILDWLKSHLDQLTFYSDNDLANELGISISSFNNALYELVKRKLVDKTTSPQRGRKAYFGYKEPKEAPKKPKKPKA